MFIFIDESGDPGFKTDRGSSRELENYLKSYLHTKIAKFSFAKSHNNLLIQLADMCAGAINRPYSNKEDRLIYQQKLQPRIKNIWPFK